MNRPLPPSAVRDRLQQQNAGGAPQAQTRQAQTRRAQPRPAQTRGPRGSVPTTLMVWVLIIYLVVPPQYLLGQAEVTTDSSMGEGNPVARAIKIALLLVSAGIILWKSRVAILEMKTLNRFFVMFLILVPMSVVWSIDPSATSARFVSILSTVMVCLAFTLVGWHRTRFQEVVRPLVVVLLVGSVLWGLAYPEYAIEVGEGTLKNSWRGLTSQKNQFGMLSSFGVILWLHAWLNKETKWFLALPFIVLSFWCVLLSRSSTSLLATTLSCVFMLFLMKAPTSLRRYMPYLVSAFAIIVVVYALAVLNIVPGLSLLLRPIAELSGKDMTFSNRAVIWDIIKEHIQLAPLLGSGYGAYWTGPVPSSPSYSFLARMYFYPSESHNGYLEIVNDLGFVGLICLLGYLVSWIRQSLELMRFDRGQGMLFLALFFQQAITNLSESTWLAINSAFALAVVTLATFAMARSLLEQRLSGAVAPGPAKPRRRRY
jgi:exopolysaccharide production protein ExoQ